ncbi:hypothetical protein, partial [Streptomyces sp. NPDC088244]|uniref:hypothetical protein n=1 Tax=Streptomyces sp. NPDC088244 TaxID=3365841 RepID=UPI0037F77725
MATSLMRFVAYVNDRVRCWRIRLCADHAFPQTHHLECVAIQKPVVRSHLIWLGRLLAVAGIVERLVPDDLWELFQRV